MTQPTAFTQDFEQLYPFERMSYVFGQVLGVREFRQDQAYFINKQRLHNRNLHGYGVLWGLDVQLTSDALVQVTPGLALDSQGREIYVDATQSAPLQTWLSEPVSDLDPATTRFASLQATTPAGSPFSVYVTLSYRTCDTELQAILGQPCRVDTGTGGVLQPTRIRDDFLLNLSLTQPLQHEERYMQLLSQNLPMLLIDPNETAIILDEPANLLFMERKIRAFWEGIIIQGAAPATSVHPNNATDFMRGLMRHWVSSVRPDLDYFQPEILELLNHTLTLNPDTPSAGIDVVVDTLKTALDDHLNNGANLDIGGIATVNYEDAAQIRRALIEYWKSKPQAKAQGEESTLLLGIVRFTHDGTNVVVAGSVVDQRQRPTLVPTRMLQELSQFVIG